MSESLKEYLKSDTSRGNYKLKGLRLDILMYLAGVPDMAHDGNLMLEVLCPTMGASFASHVSRLRKAGYLTGGHRQLQITELGLSYLDSQYD